MIQKHPTKTLLASEVTVEDDEGRFMLRIESDTQEPLMVNIHWIDLDAFYDQVKARLGPYLHEKLDAKRAVDAGVSLSEYVNLNYMGGEEAREAYDTSDPKHPDFHSIHADIHDLRGF